MQAHPTSLTIAGSDSGGGAGIQADLKTMTVLGSFGLSVITTITAQNTQGVQGIHPIPRSFIEQQLNSVFDDFTIHAIKIGMLHSKEVAELIGNYLLAFPTIPVVFDPVMVATSGDLLLEADAINAIKEHAFPVSLLITPNIHEAQVLTSKELKTERAIKEACRELHALGPRNVLIKGGDIEAPEAKDVLYLGQEDRFVMMSTPKVNTQNLHGTGCSLSSAIAALLSRGRSLEDAVKEAKSFIFRAIESGSSFAIGKGNGPINHMWDLNR